VDFSLDEQQLEIQQLATTVIAGRADAARPETDGDWFDGALWADLGKAGLLGLAVPEDDGGAGLGLVELALVVEAAAKGAGQIPVVDALVGAAAPIAHFGTPEQRARLVAPVAAGELVLGCAVGLRADVPPPFEAHSTSDGWTLAGRVNHVLLADQAIRVLVEAADGEGRAGLFLVDPRAAGATLERQNAVDRRPRWQLTLVDTPVAAEDVLVAPGSHAEGGAWLRPRLLALRCVEQLGSCRGALEMAARYVSERQQFERPVGTFQAVAHRVADAYIDTEGIALTTWQALWRLDQDLSYEEELNIAAWWAVHASIRVVEAAMHLHGGLSVDLDYPLHKYFLAVKHTRAAIGTPGQRLADLGDLIAVS